MRPRPIGPNRSPKLPAIQNRPTAAPRCDLSVAVATADCPDTRNTPNPIPSRIKSAVSQAGEVVREIARSIAASTTRTAAIVQWAGRRADSGPIGTRPEAEAIDRHAKRVPIVTVLSPMPRAYSGKYVKIAPVIDS